MADFGKSHPSERELKGLNREDVINLVDKRISQLRDIKTKRDSGELLCIPFHHKHPKLSKIVPGIVKGILYKISAGSGVGKTQLTKELFCITPLEFLRVNPDCGIRIKVFYFALEESVEEFIDNLISTRLATKFGIRIPATMLKGFHERYVDETLLNKIDQCAEDVKYYMSHIEVVDSVYNPTGLYKYCHHYSEQEGTHHWNDIEFMKDGVNYTEKIYSHYEPKDPDLHVIVITDHISLISEEYDSKTKKILTKHQAMAKWSTEYCKKRITKHWGWTVVNVQQQEQSSEKQHYTNTGSSVIEKTEPTVDALANNKEVQRDDYVIITLYSPDRFQFKDYHGYDISRFRDTFRALRVHKNRIGPPDKYVHYLFDGMTNRFMQLPKPDEDYDTLEKAYQEADKLLGR